MPLAPRLRSVTHGLPLGLGVAGVLAGGALLVLRAAPTGVGLGILGLGVLALVVAHWWRRGSRLTAWVPFLLGAAVLVAGVVVWQTLRAEETTEAAERLQLAARGVRGEVERRLERLVTVVADLAEPEPGDAPRSLQDVRRDRDRAFETHPALRAMELIGADGEIVLLAVRPGEPQRLSRPGGVGLELLEQAVERVRRTGEPTLAGPFPADGGDVAFRVLAPVADTEGPPAVVSGLVSVRGAFAGLEDVAAPRHEVRIFAGDQELFHSRDLAEATWIERLPLELPGAPDWSVEVTPGATREAEGGLGFAEMVLGVSVVVALLLTLTTWFGERAARRARSFEAAVAERTLQLEAAKAEAQAANAAKDRFLAMLGHELRNPLASISTALEVLERRSGASSGPDDRMRGIVLRQMHHLARLVDDLLDVSRIERGKLPLRLERVDLARLVRDVAETERARIEEKGVRFEVRIPPEPVWVEGDPTRLTQVVYNLVSNAAKFTGAGGAVEVRVAREGLEPAPGTAVVTVRDTGLGIDRADLQRIFEPFTQTEDAVELAAGGLGLGLPIVKGLIDAHGGEIRAASEGRGRGADVTVRLPAAEAPAPAEEAAEPAPEAAGRRVLVIDDHPDSAEGLRELLEIFGHEVEVARDGAGGLQAAERARPEVVICDIGLPDLDGYRVAAALREAPETAGTRLVALTGYGDDDSVRRAREAGFDHHLTKPVDPQELRHLLAQAGPTGAPRPTEPVAGG
ncbi:MAG TPA: ATP-binding protein [Thermoanaerobaculia bacterium]